MIGQVHGTFVCMTLAFQSQSEEMGKGVAWNLATKELQFYFLELYKHFNCWFGLHVTQPFLLADWHPPQSQGLEKRGNAKMEETIYVVCNFIKSKKLVLA